MFPYDWYWLADDGRIWGSKVQGLMSGDDPDYTARTQTYSPTPWPRDDAGNQTVQALQEVVSPYGLYVDLLAYAANKRWVTETGGMIFNGAPVSTDDRSKQMIMGARIAAAADANFVTPWVMNDGSIVQLNAQAVIALSDAVLAHVQSCFQTFANVQAGVANGSVTTRQEVDQAFAA